MSDNKFLLLRKLLKAFGLSDERIEELIGWVQTWLQDDIEKKSGKVRFPYRLRDDFLSPAELNFYRVLQQTAASWARVCPKVSLGDLFFAQSGDYSQNRIYRNKIDRKHVDFLLCDPQTVQPLLGIELDDKSHQRADRRERDRFVDGVFKAAGLPLVHIPVRAGYQTEKLDRLLRQAAGLDEPQPAAAPQKGRAKTMGLEATGQTGVETAASPPTCPKCGGQMALRTAGSGPNKGNQFWGCLNYPRCRGIVNYTDT